MSDMNLEELQVIAGFLQTIQGQGITVLVELATTRGHPPAVRLNAALALTGMYDQFALDVAEMLEPEERPMYPTPQIPVGPEPDFGDEEPEAEFDPTAWAAAESAREVEVPQSAWSEEALTEMQALGVDPSDVMQPASEATLREIEERFARQQVAAATEETGDASLGGASGLGPRNPKASRRRRKHGRR